MRFLATGLTAFAVIVHPSCAKDDISLKPAINVPAQFGTGVDADSPTGEPESVRYVRGFEAFYWHCVILKSTSLGARCPIPCSGTPGAAEGCADGSVAAQNGISDLVSRFGADRVRDYLRSIALRPEARQKTRAYFPEDERH
jgi:hypothetical protein